MFEQCEELLGNVKLEIQDFEMERIEKDKITRRRRELLHDKENMRERRL